MPPCLAFITLDPVLSGWVAVVFFTHRAVTDVVGGRTWHGYCASSSTGSGPARYWSLLDIDFFHDLFLPVADCAPTLSVTSFLYGDPDNTSDFLAFFRLFTCVIAFGNGCSWAGLTRDEDGPGDIGCACRVVACRATAGRVVACRGIAGRVVACRGIASRVVACRGIAGRVVACRGIAGRVVACRGIAGRVVASRVVACRGVACGGVADVGKRSCVTLWVGEIRSAGRPKWVAGVVTGSRVTVWAGDEDWVPGALVDGSASSNGRSVTSSTSSKTVNSGRLERVDCSLQIPNEIIRCTKQARHLVICDGSSRMADYPVIAFEVVRRLERPKETYIKRL